MVENKMEKMFSEIALSKKINQRENKLVLEGILPDQFGALLGSFLSPLLHSEVATNFFVLSDEDEALTFFNKMSLIDSSFRFYPGLAGDIYSGIVQNLEDNDTRLSVTREVSRGKKVNIVTTLSALHLKLPEKRFFTDDGLTITKDEILDIETLYKQLISLGYQRSYTVEEPGTFASKGEILDIFPFDGHPFRINFFDTLVESIHFVDPLTLITLKEKEIESAHLSRGMRAVLSDEAKLRFKNKFPRPQPGQKEFTAYRKELFDDLNEDKLFENSFLFCDYFFEEPTCLLDYAKDYSIFLFDHEESQKDFEIYFEELKNQREEFLEFHSNFLPKPEEIFWEKLDINNFIAVNPGIGLLSEESAEALPLKLKPLVGIIGGSPNINEKRSKLIKLAKNKKDEGFKVILCYTNDYKRKEIESIFQGTLDEQFGFHNYLYCSLDGGFIYQTERIFLISENDFFNSKKEISKRKPTQNSPDYDLFAQQLSTLKEGDYVIHKNHGVGLYKGIETIEHGGSTNDYLIIEYLDSDKVFVPVYKMDLVQKYSTNDTKVPVANLKKAKFNQAKAKARESVKQLAFSLIELQAKRKLKKGFSFSPPDKEYENFESSFPFTETIDQEKAIHDVIGDMTSPQPMDRLVCGDVGFGKTEVAIRASFKAVLDQKQVAILVPTTILCFQHENSFKQRFIDFPVNIESVSRLKTAKQVNHIKGLLAEGKIDILIGTHKILSSDFVYKDLGLLIIDEEQRFGVGHKEKLKLLKENVDTLTMTATPIPRTLQLSFLGIKELSLIKTPPPKRQSIKTYVIKEDEQTIKLAIEKELARKGQVYIVHNKVSDIEIYTGKIRDLVPKARITFAHGQMSERDLEKRISDFYQFKFDILISTTIIESGIDIPNANTMIIDRADTFGLSQLHQLRGRIGRSNKKAYAYFVIPKLKKLSEISMKRLRALQTFAELGSGFSISSSDLEIRGAGNILGPEQSGHINNIGLELYMELLQDAMNEIRGTNKTEITHVDVQTQFDAHIPKTYIDSAPIRLKLYKQLSSVKDIETLERETESIIDQYGAFPTPVLNLIYIVRSKIALRKLGIEHLNAASHKIHIRFSPEYLNNNPGQRDKIINFFTQRPKIYKFNPDYSINCLFKDKISIETYNEFIKNLTDNLIQD